MRRPIGRSILRAVMVSRAGLEPAISGLKVRRPHQLDHRDVRGGRPPESRTPSAGFGIPRPPARAACSAMTGPGTGCADEEIRTLNGPLDRRLPLPGGRVGIVASGRRSVVRSFIRSWQRRRESNPTCPAQNRAPPPGTPQSSMKDWLAEPDSNRPRFASMVRRPHPERHPPVENPAPRNEKPASRAGRRSVELEKARRSQTRARTRSHASCSTRSRSWLACRRSVVIVPGSCGVGRIAPEVVPPDAKNPPRGRVVDRSSGEGSSMSDPCARALPRLLLAEIVRLVGEAREHGAECSASFSCRGAWIVRFPDVVRETVRRGVRAAGASSTRARCRTARRVGPALPRRRQSPAGPTPDRSARPPRARASRRPPPERSPAPRASP